MKKRWIALAALLALAGSWLLYSGQPDRVTINFFPINPDIRFTESSVSLAADKTVKGVKIRWNLRSALEKPVYLRQDLLLLYKNGRLIQVARDWEQNKAVLLQQGSLKEKGSGLYEAAGYFYGEVHEGDKLTSTQAMDSASLYVVDSESEPFQAFERPFTKEQSLWVKTLSNNSQAVAKHALTEAVNTEDIDLTRYSVLPLTSLPAKKNLFFRDFSPERREEIIGKLWEGLYKNYILHVQTEKGAAEAPLNSTIPMLLLSHDHQELLVCFTSGSGSSIVLRQRL